MNPAPESVDAFIRELPDFSRPMVGRLRKAVHAAAPKLEEALRWGTPTYKGRNLVCGIAAFNKHVSLTFWRGASIKDPDGRLVHGQGRSEMRTAKFESIHSIDPTQVKAWVNQAVKLDSDGSAPAPPPRKPAKVAIPKALASALKENAAAGATFAALAPSCRREYCEWIADAKQPATVGRRLAATLEKLARGERLNEKYIR